MRHFCTLFDSAYLAQGLVLYESLTVHSSEAFMLHVLPMDGHAGEVLQRLQLPGVRIVTGFHEEHHGMAQAKANRTWQEYCWTCASNLCEALLLTGLREITYLDADQMFFSDPKVIFDEIGERSGGAIAVIPHRLIPSKKHLEVNGKFNVCWVTLGGPIGFWCAQRWAAQCRERCSADVGCGDQCYLDEWPGLFQDHLRVIQNIGAGAAPWNLANYELYEHSFTGQILVADPILPFRYDPLVFYHYHEYKHSVRLTNYELRPNDERLVYEPYIEANGQARRRVDSLMVNG